MAPHRRLLLGLGTVSGLLLVYLLLLGLDWPPLSSRAPLRTPHADSWPDAEQPLDPQTQTPPQTEAQLRPAANRTLNASQTGSEGAGPPPTGAPRGRPPQAPGPTEPPFIGDSYLSEDAPPPTGCPDSIRSRVKASAFGDRFLERIPVLQWARHATPDQHRRLGQYPGAHGWGGLDFHTLLETLSLLNSSANRLLLDDWPSRGGSGCSRCAVVGNGGILKGSGKGPEIDAHHYVFRSNGVVIRGFEADVGRRTTHYTFSTNTLTNALRRYAANGYRGPPQSPETRYVFLPDHDRDYLLVRAAATRRPVERGPERAKDPSQYFGADVSAEKLKMYHPDFIRYLRNRFLRSKALKTKYKDIYRPSTGAVMLLAALHSCDQVSAYGFMTPDYGRYSDHYYDGRFQPVGFFINHDLRLEMELWQQLHRAGLLRLYMRT
ncbi:alpha-N-acetylgalactosaminide alpha-2,6-sialyltransferase 2 isoform 1-T3 [Menidia menidia]